MIHRTMPVGPLQCNCHILACDRTLEACIIDPGDEADKIVQAVTSLGLKVKYLLHTHAHFDHMGATREVKDRVHGEICLHKDDTLIYQNLPMQGKMFGFSFEPPHPVEKFIDDNEQLSFGDHRLEVVHTPGHSPGGICFQLDGWVFSGDTLFRESIGRSDLWGGDHNILIRSIKNRLLNLDDDIKVFPGHGPQTTIGHERRSNPFLT